MCAAEFCADHLLSTLSGQSLHRSLGVFAEATATTVILFNQNNEIVVGPITGSSFMRQLIETPVGRQFVENAHRQAAAAEN
ncbi:MAG TPA: hypothetical protein PLS23_16280, partial [Phycisphaerae bacterium]|nr:hypothetical protein [Phycisphaerae bacterium]